MIRHSVRFLGTGVVVLFCLGHATDAGFARFTSPRSRHHSQGVAVVVPHDVYVALDEASHDEEVFNFDKSQQIYEQLLQGGVHRSPSVTGYLWSRLAYAQEEDGNNTLALESIRHALRLQPQNQTYHHFYDGLMASREWPAHAKPATRYSAMRDMGSAHRLVATNGILHIFVRGRNSDPWGDFDINQTKFAIQQTTDWIIEKTNEQDVQPRPSFEHRYLIVPEEPFWRSVNVPGHLEDRTYRASWEKQVLARFGANSYAELFDQTFEGATFLNRAVVFHANLPGRAFALRSCQPHDRSDLEVAYVYFPIGTIINPMQSIVYGHELMHLYGADDLYNKADEPGVPDQEIMKFESYRLGRCQICPITAYAIGWTDKMPQTSVLWITTTLPIQAKLAKEN